MRMDCVGMSTASSVADTVIVCGEWSPAARKVRVEGVAVSLLGTASVTVTSWSNQLSRPMVY